MISCSVSQTEMKIRTKSAITEGLVGATCQFIFSPEWDGLAKTVVFESLIAKSIVLTSRETTIPPEVLDNAAGYKLKISIVGKNSEGTIVIPTIWGIAGTIRPSGASDEYEESQWEPTPDYGAQLMVAVDQAVANSANAVEVAESVRADADAGKFNGEKGDQGESGVYVGDEEPPEGNTANVWVDTDGDGIDLEEFVEQLVEDSPTITDIKDSIDEVSLGLDTVSATVSEHTTALEAKADKSDVESQVAEINEDLALHSNTLANHENRIGVLERGGGGTVKSVNGVKPNASGDVLLTDATLPAGALDVEARNGIADLQNGIGSQILISSPEMRNGSCGNAGNANGVCTKYVQSFNGADAVKIKPNFPLAVGETYLWVVWLHNTVGVATPASSTTLRQIDPFSQGTDAIEITNDGYAQGFSVTLFKKDSSNNFIPLRIANVGNCLQIAFIYYTDALKDYGHRIIVPNLRNGSVGNAGNTNAVGMVNSVPVRDFKTVEFKLNRELQDGETVDWLIRTYATASVLSETIQIREISRTGNRCSINLYDNEKGVSASATLKINNVVQPMRVITGYSRIITVEFKPDAATGDISELNSLVNSARFKGDTLTIAHFSDLHADQASFNNITALAKELAADEIICTGDMVGNTSAESISWWNASIMTCIGNHDSAVYNASSGYNWTALTMAQRDSKYISPFKANWGITHISGKSYYYKDYSTQKIRMIILDAMLYSATANASEAAEQNTWLTNLLSDAISKAYHVIIAEHAPHGGAVSVKCGFSRYDAPQTMPTWTDCNLPDSVINIVATAISNGLTFIGYLCGHTHQDNIWDCKGDGSQLMFCVTCAATTQTAQWKDGDCYRGLNDSPFNMVTIDTTHKLIKLIRCGGGQSDYVMRSRKAICIDYAHGKVIGEC